MTYLDRARDLYAMMAADQTLEAFEKYYHDDVAITEADSTRRHGKDAQRAAIHEWMEGVDQMHGGSTDWVTSNEEEAVTMVQSTTDLSFLASNRDWDPVTDGVGVETLGDLLTFGSERTN